ncbi:hypothetical protein VB711_18010 [Cronbergia sp. UHCC 0137]|uniref:HD domain-containing protein n=1 Tax=Cronbergia sp. UHCC 0137 TaxID=3110239 RepID=UPI002B1F6850|nr:hypothetical protein [Cronbergia sp. UHCC 0137]MEA5619721.1 hypothetical protein [Cronbergia sp. UHCC 0137]
MAIANLTDILFSHWQGTILPFNVDEVASNQVFTDLITAYSHPNRYYHTLKHIHHVLKTIDTLQIYTQDLPSVQLAAWFHDVIYNTQLLDNEEKSADYAAKLLTKLKIPQININIAKNLILQTKNHENSEDNYNAYVLLDADLAILAVNPTEYQEYAKAIRQEYAWVLEADYIKGRKQVLEKFLQRPQIYYTPLMCDRSEQSARFNLQQEIDQLLQK